MAAMTAIVEAERLSSIFEIPEEMKHSRVEVTMQPIEEIKPPPKVNMEALERFRTGFNFKEHVKRKLAEGYKFDFDAQKIIDGTMTEDDWQDIYKMEKRTWGKHIVDMAKEGKGD
jgi:hypothetical protein